MGLEGEDSLPSTEGFGVSRSQMGVELGLFLVTLSRTKHPSLPHFPPRDKAGIKKTISKDGPAISTKRHVHAWPHTWHMWAAILAASAPGGCDSRHFCLSLTDPGLHSGSWLILFLPCGITEAFWLSHLPGRWKPGLRSTSLGRSPATLWALHRVLIS